MFFKLNIILKTIVSDKLGFCQKFVSLLHHKYLFYEIFWYDLVHIVNSSKSQHDSPGNTSNNGCLSLYGSLKRKLLWKASHLSFTFSLYYSSEKLLA